MFLSLKSTDLKDLLRSLNYVTNNSKLRAFEYFRNHLVKGGKARLRVPYFPPWNELITYGYS